MSDPISADHVHLAPPRLIFTPSGLAFQDVTFTAQPDGDQYALTVSGAQGSTLFRVPVSVLHELTMLEELELIKPLTLDGITLPEYELRPSIPLVISAAPFGGDGVLLTSGNDFLAGVIDSESEAVEWIYPPGAGYVLADHDGPGCPLLTIYSPGYLSELAEEDAELQLFHLTVYILPDALRELLKLIPEIHRGPPESAHLAARRAAWLGAGLSYRAEEERGPEALN